MKNKNNIKTNNKFIKILIAIIMIMGLIICADIVIKKVNIQGLEGYMYSLASDIVNINLTGENATCSNATSSNATSSNATSSNATSSNATSSNVNTIVTMTPEEIHQEVEEKLYEDYQEKYYEEYENYENFYEVKYEEYYNNKVDELEKEAQKNDMVTFLEDNKIYIIIIGIAVLTAIITGVILIVDKATKKS